MKKSVLLVLLMFGFLCWASAANADSFSFDNITNNNAGDAAIGEAQLSVDVLSGTGLVLFKFYNNNILFPG